MKRTVRDFMNVLKFVRTYIKDNGNSPIGNNYASALFQLGMAWLCLVVAVVDVIVAVVVV